MARYNPKEIENKWIEEWDKSGLYKTKKEEGKDKFYSLYSFPYPSGSGLHVGHA
jgi:leucyl-tRNA synthetase